MCQLFDLIRRPTFLINILSIEAKLLMEQWRGSLMFVVFYAVDRQILSWLDRRLLGQKNIVDNSSIQQSNGKCSAT